MGLEELYMRFPVVLRDKLLNCEIEFPPLTRFSYAPLLTYRAVNRKEDDNRPISRDDFKSYYEIGKSPKGKEEFQQKWIWRKIHIIMGYLRFCGGKWWNS